MIARQFTDVPPRITFTADFHELVRGDLVPGETVTLRYDPARIVPPGEGYEFGDPAHRIVVHVLFPPHRDIVSIPLWSPSGMLESPDKDATGGGDMLVATAEIPADATAMVLWFIHDGPYGGTGYDSDFGRNFQFGFTSRQIEPVEATLRPTQSGNAAAFAIKVAAAPEVLRVVMRMRVVATPALPKSEHDLKRTGARQTDGWSLWGFGPVEVPSGAVVQFKLYYWVGHARYKDDNSGLYYLVHAGAAERVPPPPAALAVAAKAWT